MKENLMKYEQSLWGTCTGPAGVVEIVKCWDGWQVCPRWNEYAGKGFDRLSDALQHAHAVAHSQTSRGLGGGR